MSLRACLLTFVGAIVACNAITDGDFGTKERAPTSAPATAATATTAVDAPAPVGVNPFTCDPAPSGVIGDQTLQFPLDGDTRTVLLHVPKSYDATKGTQLILAFHGYGGSADQMRDQTSFNVESEKRGFIVAYVQGTGIASKGFNAGDCCGKPAWTSHTDDVGLTRAIVKSLTSSYCVDPKRIFNAGFSNGGFMSYRFICEASDIFAAVASVSGVLGVPPEGCSPTRPVPVFHVHGTGDKTVPYNGGGAEDGLGSLVNITFRSVADTVTAFKTKWTCGATSKELSKSGDTRCEEWSGCQAGVTIDLCTVTDGGHQWPGGKPTPVGGKTSDFTTTQHVLDFFDAHPMP
jgi:polyhydroxybutyrate depolymerase